METYPVYIFPKPPPPIPNVILLLPKYRQKLKIDKIQTKIIKIWDTNSIEELSGCLELTDWDVFLKNSDSDLNQLTEKLLNLLLFDFLC